MARYRTGYRRRRRPTPAPYTPPTPYTPTPWSAATLRPVPHVTRPLDSIDMTFASLSELADLAAAPSPCPPADRASHTTGASDDWDLSTGFDAAVSLARLGWQEGAAKSREYSDALFAKVSAKMTKALFLFEDQGMTWDLGRVVANEAECWLTRHEIEGESEGPRFIRLVANVSASAGIDARTLYAKGSVITALVELLEYAGHRVEVTVAHAATRTRRFATFVRVKQFSEPIDLPVVAFALGHPAMLRRLLFAAYESRESHAEREAIGVHGWGGYGIPNNLADDERGDIYCPSAYLYDDVPWQDPKAGVAWILHHLKGQGVHVNMDGTEDDA